VLYEYTYFIMRAELWFSGSWYEAATIENRWRQKSITENKTFRVEPGGSSTQEHACCVIYIL